MAGTFIPGETKVRPGTYYNVQKNDGGTLPGATDGVVAVLFRSDFGPLCQVTELQNTEDYEAVFGNGGTTDALKYAIEGGARTLMAIRVGSGGTPAQMTLKDSDDKDAVKITAKYPGAKEFSVTIKDVLPLEANKRECVIYSGMMEFEKAVINKGANEAAALVNAFADSSNFTVTLLALADESAPVQLESISQAEFTVGENPKELTVDYSSALVALETVTYNTICLDTEDVAVHTLLVEYLTRIELSGMLAMGVVAEKRNVSLEERMKHAAAFNDYKMHYVLNANVFNGDTELDGYQTAAMVAGAIAAAPSNRSLTHNYIQGIDELNEVLTPTQMIKAQQNGCLTFSYSSGKLVWIDSAINTLVQPDDNHDEGWKKIRRTKTRFELMSRMNTVVEEMIGKVDNDLDGRLLIVSNMREIGTAMIEEGKLISCAVSISEKYKSDGDSAWFDISVVDKDSAERIYLTYTFQFSTIQ
jgi:hypothetical protein